MCSGISSRPVRHDLTLSFLYELEIVQFARLYGIFHACTELWGDETWWLKEVRWLVNNWEG